MQSNAYTAFIGLFLFVLLNVTTMSTLCGQNENDIFDLQIQTEMDCSQNILTANLQIKTQGDTFRIGTSSILFRYDETVLTFLEYTSENFDENDKVSIFGSETRVWDAHKFNSSTAGICNLTLLAELPPASFPTIATDWITIGVAKFTVNNTQAAPDFNFDIENTNFNRHAPNDGTAAPTKGTLSANNEILNAQCTCDPPTLGNDTLNLACPRDLVEHNIMDNDIVANPTFSIVTDPERGTATINSDGILKYTPTTSFCGSDQLTYQVCNDGDATCCAEGKVIINFSDELPPIFMNPPADTRVVCGAVPEMGNIQALDNCQLREILKNEVIEDGDCGSSKVHVRTWTAVDVCGNEAVHTQKITVIDDIPPTITCREEVTINCQNIIGDNIESDQPTVSDNCASLDQLTVTFADEQIVDICENKIQQQFNRVWTVTDPCGNFATCRQLIKIIDDIEPTITCPADITVDCGQDIAPENLASSATATDECSDVTITFSDEGTMPTNCEFESITITRKWLATDACGNESSCTQLITIIGTPCPEVTRKEVVAYECEKAVVNLAALANLSDETNFSFTDKNTQEPIFNTAQYLLPSTGCEIGNFEFGYQVFNDRQCLVENNVLIIKTIPRIIAETQLSEDECTAKLVLECPELYDIKWESGDQTGSGNTFEAGAGETGVVVFTLEFSGLTLPDDLDLSCLSQQYEVAYNCPIPCPPGIQEEVTVVGCQGDFVNLRNRLQLSNLDRFDTEENITNIQEFELKGVEGNCGFTKKTIVFLIYNENDCLTREVTLNLEIIQPIRAEITHDNGFCKATLSVECAELYEVNWKDSEGKTGEGSVYEGTEGTSGFVTFYINSQNEAYLDFPCAKDSISADFACEIVCPAILTKDTTLTACAGENLNLKELLNVRENLDYTFEFLESIAGASISNGQLEIGNPFGCEKGFLNLNVKSYDERQCLIEMIEIQVAVLPKIEGGIEQLADGTCEVLLNLECPNLYKITWEDTDGNRGEGNVFVPAENTSGTVTFAVKLNVSNTDLSSQESNCYRQIFEFDYSCIAECPPSVVADYVLEICGEETINIYDYLGLTSDARFTINGAEIDDNKSITFSNEGCEPKSSGFEVVVFDENDCPVTYHGVGVVVYPLVKGTIAYESTDDFCTPKLRLTCEENYKVTWADDLGNNGEGNIYNATTGTNGVVAFYVQPLTDESILKPCPIDTFYADFNCISTCPATVERTESMVLCAETEVNLKERLDLDKFQRFSTENEPLINGIYQVGNPFGCESGVKTLEIKGYDEQQCLVEIIILEIKVIPAIYAEVVVREEAACEVKLSVECVDNYEITWEDTDGNRGEGTTYEAAENTSGSVTFTLNYLTEETILSDIELGCFSQTFTGQYGCEKACPEKGTPCTDGDLATINDAEDGNCNCVGETVPEIRSEIDLRFRPKLDCEGNTYCVLLQAKAQQVDFFIGTSSIMVNYNAEALEFSNYTSHQFDETTDCTGGNASLWEEHQFDGSSVAGKFCLTMSLNGEGMSCPEITTKEWADIGTICFDIMDNQATPKVVFEEQNTHFNSAEKNDGSAKITLGKLGEIVLEDALACATPETAQPNELALKAMLQGPYRVNQGLMIDQLRRKSFIPQKEPYTGIPSFTHIGDGGGEEIADDLLQVTGEDAIVDWVFIELRSARDSTMVIATRSALIQRDGEVMDTDGSPTVKFNVPDGNYYVCVKHRNHLGVMTAAPLAFNMGTPATLDFTNPQTPTYGENALLDARGTMVLWGGNANPDGYLILAGGGLGLPDRDMIFFDIFLSLWYANPNVPITYNSVLHGYYGSDTNMDGKVKYQGPKNDIDAIIFFNVLFHPNNTQYRLNYAIFEQIP